MSDPLVYRGVTLPSVPTAREIQKSLFGETIRLYGAGPDEFLDICERLSKEMADTQKDVMLAIDAAMAGTR